jgi:hypothetical protein
MFPNVTKMSNMFYRAAKFNQDIGCWDVSNVMTMRFMFGDARAFNQDLTFSMLKTVVKCSGAHFPFGPIICPWIGKGDSDVTARRLGLLP